MLHASSETLQMRSKHRIFGITAERKLRITFDFAIPYEFLTHIHEDEYARSTPFRLTMESIQAYNIHVKYIS